MSSVTLANNSHTPYVPTRLGAVSAAARGMAWVAALWTQLASRHATVRENPLSRFQEAEQVRAMAHDWQHRDPGFAQDLYAAADRHEFD